MCPRRGSRPRPLFRRARRRPAAASAAGLDRTGRRPTSDEYRSWRRPTVLIRYLLDSPPLVEFLCHSPESLWQQNIIAGSTSRDSIEQFEGSVRNIDREFVAVTNESLHRHVRLEPEPAALAAAQETNSSVSAGSTAAFPGQDPEEVSEAVGRHPGMEENPPNISRACIVVILEGGETQPPKVVEKGLSPCRFECGVRCDVQYRDQLRLERALFVVFSSYTRSCKYMHRRPTPKEPLAGHAGADSILETT